MAARGLAPEPPRTAKVRHVHIDVAKAVGISLMVLAHSWPVEVLLRHPVTTSTLGPAIPGFMAASGFLYAKSPTVANVRRRLFRLIAPYFFATLAVVVEQRRWTPGAGISQSELSEYVTPASRAPLAEDFLLGLTLPHYYYVFIIVLCATRTLKALLVAFVLLHVASKAIEEAVLGMNVTWILRNPFDWVPYFLCGWLSPMWAAVPRWKPALALLVALPMQILLPYPVGMLLWMYAVVICLPLLFPPGTRIPGVGEFLAWLSANSYTVFLFHSFFIEASYTLLTHAGLQGALLYWSVWASTMSGCMLLAYVVLAVLGPDTGSMIFGVSPDPIEVNGKKQQGSEPAQAMALP